MDEINSWLIKKNEPFSLIVGDDYTNGDILKSFLGIVVFVFVVFIVCILNK